MLLLYRFFIRLYHIGIRVAAVRSEKARAWLDGRKNLFQDLEQLLGQPRPTIWVHCASAGELEQGKPVIEGLKATYPGHRVLVSFFSPSGYSVGKKYGAADAVTYLPLDTASNARRFLDRVKPELAVFVKYEYWYHHLTELHTRQVPVLLVSAIFREQQVFFTWYGGFFRNLLRVYSRIFVQDPESALRLQSIGITAVTVAGDTRFDRVGRILEERPPIPEIETFVADHQPVIVAGSTWPEDEDLLAEGLALRGGKLIIAPHELDEGHLQHIEARFPGAARFSRTRGQSPAAVLIIDNIGMLSRLYQYATISYIGGGFNKSGIHNTLEAAVWSKPVFFGPNYQKFREARELIEAGAAFSASTPEELKTKTDHFLDDPDALTKAGSAAGAYVAQNRGATNTILNYVQANRLLTS